MHTTTSWRNGWGDDGGRSGYDTGIHAMALRVAMHPSERRALPDDKIG